MAKKECLLGHIGTIFEIFFKVNIKWEVNWFLKRVKASLKLGPKSTYLDVDRFEPTTYQPE